MITRSIYIGTPGYLKLKDEQMIILDPNSKEQKGQVPIEDLGLLMLDNFQITLSHQLIQKLMNNNVVIISCDEFHLPKGIMLPFYGHTEHSDRVKHQIEASEPLKKQLWKQTIEAKIKNQISVLKYFDCNYQPMLGYLSNVKSGDSTNMEGISAQHYWKNLINPSFLRDRFGDYPNTLFNYGYAIIRSMIARSIVETGLLPVIGIYHRNKYNPFCLADDIMEPYRPFLDFLVINWLIENPYQEEISKDFKAYILRIATHDVKIEGKTRPLLIAMKNTTTSLFKTYTGEKRHISYPEFE